MEIPQVNEKVWADLLTDSSSDEFSFLALRILLSRLRLNVKQDCSPECLQKNVSELRDFFVKTQNIPNSMKDLQKISGLVYSGKDSYESAIEHDYTGVYTVDEVREMILQKKKLALAGDEKSLEQLPAGNWIGGTIPYFMTSTGGEVNRDKIFVTEIPPYIKKTVIKLYNEDSIPDVYSNSPANGFSIIIIPASSPIHLAFAMKAPAYKDFATHPLMGWISGTHLDDIGRKKAKVFFGGSAKAHENAAVVMHLELPEGKFAELNILNIFKQGKGDTILFENTGFSVSDAIVNGKKINFMEYVKSGNIDTRLPLVADYNSSMINVSFQGLDEAAKKVNFYAPVFTGVKYRLADPVKNYISEFTNQMPTTKAMRIFYSCNCILNYLYSELDGKKTGGITGPFTFGEIAFQLLNQTMVYVSINDKGV